MQHLLFVCFVSISEIGCDRPFLFQRIIVHKHAQKEGLHDCSGTHAGCAAGGEWVGESRYDKWIIIAGQAKSSAPSKNLAASKNFSRLRASSCFVRRCASHDEQQISPFISVLPSLSCIPVLIDRSLAAKLASTHSLALCWLDFIQPKNAPKVHFRTWFGNGKCYNL